MKALLKMNLQEMIQKAEKAGACTTELSKLRQFSDMKDLMKNASDEDKAFWAYWYAHKVIKGRWEEAEPIIMTSPEETCYYARNIIKGRWKEAEPITLTDPEAAYYYLSMLSREGGKKQKRLS